MQILCEYVDAVHKVFLMQYQHSAIYWCYGEPVLPNTEIDPASTHPHSRLDTEQDVQTQLVIKL